MIQKIFAIITKRKLLSIVLLICIIGCGYFVVKKINTKEDNTKYIIGTVEKGNLVVSVSGTGQVSSSNQVSIQTKASGDVLVVNVKAGDFVKKGSVIASLNSKDAQKNVRDAETNLESAKLSLEKIKRPVDSNTILQSENALQNARDNLEKLKLSQTTEYQKALDTKKKSEDNIEKAYEDAFNTIVSAFLDLSSVVTGIKEILYSDTISTSEPSIVKGQDNASVLINTTDLSDRDDVRSFLYKAEKDYVIASEKYNINFNNYKNTSRYSDRESIGSLLIETITTTKALTEVIKSENNFIDSWVQCRLDRNKSVFSKIVTYQNDLSIYTGRTNTHLSNLLSIQRTLQDNLESLRNSENNLREMDQNNPLNIRSAESVIKEKELNLSELKLGADHLDIRSQELIVRQRENSLYDAREKLSDYTIRAPFDGILAKINVKTGDSVSSGSSIATLITDQNTAEISLNEVDVAKIKTGQKSTLTFDAIDNLSITGEVVEIDALGTVTQGVVIYTVKILFDIQDDRIKPGMSVSASIITETRQDVILVPQSAIKSQNGFSYVETVLENINQDYGNAGVVLTMVPLKQNIEIGISNDISVEVISGLKEGDRVITRTISEKATNQTSTPSIFGTGSGRGMGITR